MSSTGSIKHAHRALDALTALRSVDVDGRPLTEVDRDALALWPGWGPLAPVFERDLEGEWVTIADRLDDLTAHDPTLLDGGAEICDTAFFTPAHVVETVWALLRAPGVTRGGVVEPGGRYGRVM